MSKTRIEATSAVQHAARTLREMAMYQAEGTLIGSEEDLVRQLRVSRPTLRQAGALVAQEQLIRIKRGVNGGYFSTRPSSLTVARMAAIYLQSHQAGLRELIEAVEPIRGALARMAARNRDTMARQALEDVLASERALADEGATDYRAFLRAERAFGRVLGELSGNTVLELFLNIVYDLAARVSGEDDVYANHPERIEQYRAHRNRMAAAILDGDEELAVLATRRCSAIVTDWMNEDLGGGGFEKRDQAGVARQAS